MYCLICKDFRTSNNPSTGNSFTPTRGNSLIVLLNSITGRNNVWRASRFRFAEHQYRFCRRLARMDQMPEQMLLD
jgi:hypothetical protein